MGSLDELYASVLNLAVTTNTADSKSMPEILNAANTEIEALRQQVAEQKETIEQNRDACIGLNDYFGKQIKEQAALIDKLAEALNKNQSAWKTMSDYPTHLPQRLMPINNEALAAYEQYRKEKK